MLAQNHANYLKSYESGSKEKAFEDISKNMLNKCICEEDIILFALVGISCKQYNKVSEMMETFIQKYLKDSNIVILLLIYSLKAFEQHQEFEENETNNENHVIFWRNELEFNIDKRLYFKTKRDINTIGICGYPISLNVECTTYCNSKCTSCTHEELIQKNERCLKNSDLLKIKYTVKKLKLMTLLHDIPEKLIDFNATGLGEPILYPNLLDVYKYARRLFPEASLRLNTNGIALDENKMVELINVPIDILIISLCYYDSKTYKDYMGTDKYEIVISNIRKFLKLKGDKKPQIIVHIFDNEINTNYIRGNFIRDLSPLLSPRDSLNFYPYLNLTNEGIANHFQNNARTMQECPCSQMWSVITVDVEGNIFPCCLGVWKKYNEWLSLGKITDSLDKIYNKLLSIRNDHMKANYGICSSCSHLKDPMHDEFFEKLWKESNGSSDKVCKGMLPNSPGFVWKILQSFYHKAKGIPSLIIFLKPIKQIIMKFKR